MEERLKKKLWVIARLAISVALVFLLSRIFDLSTVPALFLGIRPAFIALALLLILLSVAVSARKWLVLVRSQNINAGYGELFASYLTGLFFNNFLPSSIGGDAARAIAVGKKRGRIPEVASSVVAERLIAMASLAFVGLVGSAFSRFHNLLALILLAAVFAFALFVNAVLVSGWLPGPLRRGSGKISRAVRAASESARLLRDNPLSVARSFAGAVVFQIIVALVMQSCLFALGAAQVPFADIVFIASASSVLAMVPASINGYGLREGSYAILLAPYGISASVAVSASLLFAFLVAGFSITGLFTWLVSSRKITPTIKDGQYA